MLSQISHCMYKKIIKNNKLLLYMKKVIRTVVFHLLCILFFSLLYLYFKEEYYSETKKELNIIDCILLSTTIQASVGITNIYPTGYYGKIIMIIQQFVMIMSHVFTLYIFTL